MKDYDKNKESWYLQYWNVNDLYGWAMSQKLSVNNFGWIKDTSQFNKDFRKQWWRMFFWSWCSIIWKIKIGKAEKHVANLRDKTEYVKKKILEFKMLGQNHIFIWILI